MTNINIYHYSSNLYTTDSSVSLANKPQVIFNVLIGQKVWVKEEHNPHFVYCSGKITHMSGFLVLLIVKNHVYVCGIS